MSLDDYLRIRKVKDRAEYVKLAKAEHRKEFPDQYAKRGPKTIYGHELDGILHHLVIKNPHHSLTTICKLARVEWKRLYPASEGPHLDTVRGRLMDMKLWPRPFHVPK